MARRDSDKLAHLRGVDLLHECTDADLQAVAAITEEVQLLPGSMLCEQGRVADCCYVLLEGDADVVVAGQHMTTVGAGQTIGEMGLLDHLPRSATVTAKTAIRALRIPADKFDRLLDSSAIARALLTQISLRLREVQSGRRAAPL
jgi:CRP-like cAMP-binding protein